MKESCLWHEIVASHYKDNWDRLVKRYYFLGDGAEDVVQEAYERAIRYASSFNGEDFDKWFNTILRNSMRDYRRAEMGRPEEEEINEYHHIGSECSGIENRLWGEIFALIEEKSPSHAEVLNLYFGQGYSYKDISAVTEHTYFNAYRIISRFKEELINKYKE